VRKNNT